MNTLKTTKFLWSKLSWFLLAVVPAKLSGRTLLMYLQILSNLRRVLGVQDTIRKIEEMSDGCYRLCFTTGETLLVPQAERITRFISGYEKSLHRILWQYKMEEFDSSGFNLILDVGANLGEFSIAALRKFGSTVISVEPVDKTYSCLRSNLFQYADRSKSYNFVLGNRDYIGPFFVSTSLENSSSVKPQTPYAKIYKEVKTLSKLLDELHIEVVDLLKMDAEGFEPEVLEGLENSHIKVLNFTIDCSPERLGKSTLEEVSEFFIKHKIPHRVHKDSSSRRIVLVGGENLLND